MTVDEASRLTSSAEIFPSGLSRKKTLPSIPTLRTTSNAFQPTSNKGGRTRRRFFFTPNPPPSTQHRAAAGTSYRPFSSRAHCPTLREPKWQPVHGEDTMRGAANDHEFRALGMGSFFGPPSEHAKNHKLEKCPSRNTRPPSPTRKPIKPIIITPLHLAPT